MCYYLFEDSLILNKPLEDSVWLYENPVFLDAKMKSFWNNFSVKKNFLVSHPHFFVFSIISTKFWNSYLKLLDVLDTSYLNQLKFFFQVITY